MKTYDLVTREDDMVLVTFTASEVDAQLILDQFAHSSNYEEEFELIEADHVQREVIPAMYESSELQGAVDQFNDVFGADYLSVLEAGARLKDIVNDYLDQVLIHVDRI